MALPINIEDLLFTQSVESSRIEYKESWNEVTARSIFRTICAFANDLEEMGGGYIIIGVAEENGVVKMPIKGIDKAQVDKIQKKIIEYCHCIFPTYYPKISVEVVGDAYLLVLWIPTGVERPYSVSKNVASTKADQSIQRYYVRRGSVTEEAKGSVITELMALKNRVPFDERGNPQITPDDISSTLLRDHLIKVGSKLADSKQSIEELLESMGLITGPPENRMIKNVAAMMFCDHPEKFFPCTRAEIVRFPNGRLEDPSNLIELPPITGSVPTMINKILDYMKTNVIQETVIKPKDRAESIRYFNYPYQALEEAIVNAFYHRDYQISEPVEITIEPHRISILSHSGPDPSIPDSVLKRADIIRSRKYRNRRLGDFLKELKLTEARASGFPTIQSELMKNGSARACIDTGTDRSYFMLDIPCWGQQIKSRHEDDYLLPNLRQIFQRAKMREIYVADIPNDEQLRLMIKILQWTSEPLPMGTIVENLKDRSRATVQRSLIAPLIAVGLLEMTLPSVPRSGRQRYVSTTAAAVFMM